MVDHCTLFNLIIAVNKQKTKITVKGSLVFLSKWYDMKMIKSGDVYEVFRYERAIKLGESKNTEGRRIEASDEDKKRHRRDTLSKAKTTVRRLINANVNAWGESP